MWNFINTEIVNITQTQNITHTMVTHNNESALTIVALRHAFAEISFRRKKPVYMKCVYLEDLYKLRKRLNCLSLQKKGKQSNKQTVTPVPEKYKCLATCQLAV